FDAAVGYAAATTPGRVATGDLNGDGLVDVVVADSSSNNSVNVLLNAPPGGTVSSATVTVDVAPAVDLDTTSVAAILPELVSLGTNLPGTAASTGNAALLVTGISLDGVNFTDVTAEGPAIIEGTYLNFEVNQNGTNSLVVETSGYETIDDLFTAIEDNEGIATPLTDTFYYRVYDGVNVTIDRVTYALSDLGFTNISIAPVLGATHDVALSLGSLQVFDYGDGFGEFGQSSEISVTVEVTFGSLDIGNVTGGGTVSFDASYHSVTVTGTAAEINADLAALSYTATGAGETYVMISGIDGPVHTPAYRAGRIVVDDALPTVDGDMAITVVKGSGVELTTSDLSAADLGSALATLTFTVVETSRGHLVYSDTAQTIALGQHFTLGDVQDGKILFVTDNVTYVGAGGIALTLSDGVTRATPDQPVFVGVSIVDAEFRIRTTGDYNFDQDDPIVAMGSGVVVPDATDPDHFFRIVNEAANRDFVFTGNGLFYNPDTQSFNPGGTIVSILEVTHDTQEQLASFTLNVPADQWYNAVVARAGGDQSPIESLVSQWTFSFIGNAGADSFGAADLNDVFTGNGGND
ncbi:MAG: cadherin-like domain-containing protein, partial [Rhodoglobus sp.]|nr:cadherin-like domain-containing protein [Rhodoglobus sp.]